MGNLTINTVPGAGGFDKFEKKLRPFLSFCTYNEQGHSGISGTSTVHLGLNFVTKHVLSAGYQFFKMAANAERGKC